VVESGMLINLGPADVISQGRGREELVVNPENKSA